MDTATGTARTTDNTIPKGRLNTIGSDTVTKENHHCHPPSIKDVGVEQFLSQIPTENSNETPANVLRENLLKAPELQLSLNNLLLFPVYTSF